MCCMALLPSSDHCTVRGPGKALTLLLHLLGPKGQFFRLTSSRDRYGSCQSCLYSLARLLPCTWSEATLTCLADPTDLSLPLSLPHGTDMGHTWYSYGQPSTDNVPVPITPQQAWPSSAPAPTPALDSQTRTRGCP